MILTHILLLMDKKNILIYICLLWETSKWFKEVFSKYFYTQDSDNNFKKLYLYVQNCQESFYSQWLIYNTK